MHASEIAMIGRIVASATHELNNVLGIVKDAGGLMSDVLKLNGGAVQHADKIDRAAGKIAPQVLRGTAITAALNRFAHLMDDPRSKQDAAGLAETACLLMSRLARQRKVTLQSQPPRKDAQVETDATRLFLMLCAMLDACALQAGEDQTVTLAVERDKREVFFRALSPSAAPWPQEELARIAGELNLRLEPCKDSSQGGLCLAAPRA